MSSYVIKREKVEQRQTADKDKVDHDKQKKYIDKKPDIVINTNGDGSINIHSHTLFPEPAAIFQQSLSKIVYGGGEINEMFLKSTKIPGTSRKKRRISRNLGVHFLITMFSYLTSPQSSI